MSSRIVLPGPLLGRITAPPSKSYTHRGAVLAHLAGRRFVVENPLEAEDTRATRQGLRALGAEIELRAGTWSFRPASPPRPRRGRVVRCGSSGTTLRLLLGLAALDPAPTVITGSAELARRPVAPLVAALRAHGARLRVVRTDGSFRVRVQGPLEAGSYAVQSSESSQYASSLLFVLSQLSAPSTLRLTGRPVSQPYFGATLAVLRAHGIAVQKRGPHWEVPAPIRPTGSRFAVTGDASSAAILWCGAAISGGSVEVRAIDTRWPQADLAVLDLLRHAGASVRQHASGIRVEAADRRPFRFDFDPCPDLLPLGGVLAAYSPGESTLSGGAHAARKESDRPRATMALARALGATVRRHAGRILIRGGIRPASLHFRPPPDHRVVMATAVASLGLARPSRIAACESVGKSYPGFWEDLGQLSSGRSA
ncbi:MAG: 3-phosphoshikimate 1-carboxyvinyltransferase [Thermoplasmata archaeon]|nr:3-phosphoshikimate 1-carboxyvinyltransferase [Thermoplasmata archaeon]